MITNLKLFIQPRRVCDGDSDIYRPTHTVQRSWEQCHWSAHLAPHIKRTGKANNPHNKMLM